MNAPTETKIIIVGGGPAGLAAALHIAQLSPALAAEMLILEAAAYPRPKLCGGGVTFHGETQLAALGLHVDVPSFVIHRLQFRLGARAFTVACRDVMRVIQRSEFDAALAEGVVAHGLRLQANERLLDLTPLENGVLVVTSRGRYRAQVVIGADGANSMVRRKMQLPSTAGIARLLRVLTAVDPQQEVGWREQTAVFDFSCVLHGIQGYVWDFPCLVHGAPHMNRGIFDSRIAPPPADRAHGALKQTFAASLQDRDVDLSSVPLEGHPVRWFNPQAQFAQPHLLLTGDAAGVDPLFAEGISYAMEYGEIVAQMVLRAFETGDFSFAQYRETLLRHDLGKMLRRRTLVARSLYQYQRPGFWSLFWQLANVASPRLQRIFGASLGLMPPLNAQAKSHHMEAGAVRST